MAIGNRRKRIRKHRNRSDEGDRRSPPCGKDVVTLADLGPGQSARVVTVDTGDRGRLLKLAALGLVPGCTIRLQQRRPAYVLWVDETLLSLDRAVATTIVVQPL